MIIFLSLIGVLLSIILISFNAKKFTSSIYLGAFFLLISLYVFNQYIFIYSKNELLVKIFLLAIPITCTLFYLIGPMLYWYIRSVLTDNNKIHKEDLWHLLPAAIFLISAIPIIFSPIEQKAEAASAIVKNASAMEQYKPTLLSEVLSYPTMFLSRPLLAFGYTIWAIILLIRHLIKVKKVSVLSKQTFMIKWLIVFLGSFFILLCSQIIRIFDFTTERSGVLFSINSLQIISSLGLIGLLISPFFFPKILYGLPQVPQRSSYSNKNADKVFITKGRTKENTCFEDDYLKEIDQKIKSIMDELKPYLNQGFNLAGLAKLIHIPTHHLAYFFREVQKQSFNAYRNEWRIKHAKTLIKNGKMAEFTIEAIGIQSGFSSKSAFFSSFKKVEGITPGTFAAQEITKEKQIK